MAVAKSSESKFIHLLIRCRGLFISVGILTLITYILFYCPSTRLTEERIIDLVCKRSPPIHLLLPGQVIDVEQTMNYKP